MIYNTQAVITYIRSLFVNKVCDRVYSTNPPTTLSSGDAVKFMVISIDNLSRKDVYGTVNVRIELFLKSKTNGVLDVVEFERLKLLVDSIISEGISKDSTPYTIMDFADTPISEDYDKTMGYHVYFPVIKVLIK